MRLALIAIGWLAVALAVLGIVLPLLPTTPFVLLAAGCFSRASARCHRWLLRMPVLGAALADYQAGRGVSLRIKLTALLMLWSGIGATALLATQNTAVRLVLAALAATVSTVIVRLPTAANPPDLDQGSQVRGGVIWHPDNDRCPRSST